MVLRAAMLARLTALVLAVPHVNAADPDQQAQRERGWNALRAMDCARCHGRDHDGWAAPSLIASVRNGSRERFDHWVLEGDIGRGMPGYRSQSLVVAELDAIYAYLLARARGEIGPGRPSGAAVPDSRIRPPDALPCRARATDYSTSSSPDSSRRCRWPQRS
jgi:mono/diheme cytochrome c family protein